MAVFAAREVLALAAGVRDDDADEANRDHRLGDEFHRREQAVDVVGAFHQHALLAAAATAGSEEGLGLLEAVVAVADVGCQQLVAVQRRAVLHRDDGELVAGVFAGHFLQHHGREGPSLVEHLAHALAVLAFLRVHAQRVGVLLRHDDEEGRVDDVRALAQHLALRPLLAAAGKEGAHVEEVTHRGVAGQRLAGRQVDAVAREDVADLALRHRHHRVDVDAELQRREEVEAAAAQPGLEAGLAVQRQQAGLDRAARAPELFHDADAVVGDVAHGAGEAQHPADEKEDEQTRRHGGGRAEEVVEHR